MNLKLIADIIFILLITLCDRYNNSAPLLTLLDAATVSTFSSQNIIQNMTLLFYLLSYIFLMLILIHIFICILTLTSYNTYVIYTFQITKSLQGQPKIQLRIPLQSQPNSKWLGFNELTRWTSDTRRPPRYTTSSCTR